MKGTTLFSQTKRRLYVSNTVMAVCHALSLLFLSQFPLSLSLFLSILSLYPFVSNLQPTN